MDMETGTSDGTEGMAAVSTEHRTAAYDAQETCLAGEGALGVSTASIGMFEASLRALDVEQRVIGLRLPARFRAMRYIRAYSDYFSPHTPILPMQTFSMSTAHREYFLMSTLTGYNLMMHSYPRPRRFVLRCISC